MNERMRKGTVAECIVQTELLDRGYSVSEPVGVEPYDLVVETADGFKKVQVKVADDRNDKIRAPGYRNVSQNEVEPYTSDEVNVFALYSFDIDITLYVPFEEMGEKSVAVKISEASDYFDFPHGS